MRRLPLLLSLALMLTVSLAASASAAVKVRVAVRPDTIPQCHPGRLFAAIANTGDHPIAVRVSLSLMRGDSLVLGPFGGHLRLAPGERRHREIRFRLPPHVRPGPYAWVMRAFASDSTRDRAAAPFFVVPGMCPPPGSGLIQTEGQNDDILRDLGLEPEDTSGTVRESWGSIKRRYR